MEPTYPTLFLLTGLGQTICLIDKDQSRIDGSAGELSVRGYWASLVQLLRSYQSGAWGFKPYVLRISLIALEALIPRSSRQSPSD